METEIKTASSTNRRGDPNYPICANCAFGTVWMIKHGIAEININRQISKPFAFFRCNHAQVNRNVSNKESNRNKCKFNLFVEKKTTIKSK